MPSSPDFPCCSYRLTETIQHWVIVTYLFIFAHLLSAYLLPLFSCSYVHTVPGQTFVFPKVRRARSPSLPGPPACSGLRSPVLSGITEPYCCGLQVSDFREQLLACAGVEAERVVEFSCGENPCPGWNGPRATLRPLVVMV